MSINPQAIVFWVFCALIGYLVDGSYGAACGAAGGIGLSLLLQLLD